MLSTFVDRSQRQGYGLSPFIYGTTTLVPMATLADECMAYCAINAQSLPRFL